MPPGNVERSHVSLRTSCWMYQGQISGLGESFFVLTNFGLGGEIFPTIAGAGMLPMDLLPPPVTPWNTKFAANERVSRLALLKLVDRLQSQSGRACGILSRLCALRG